MCKYFKKYKEFLLGNIKEKSIYEVWNGQKMNNLRELHKDGRYAENPWCKKCVDGIRGEYGDTPLIEIKSFSEKNS